MGRSKRYTDEDFTNAVRSSESIRQVLRKIGLVEAGGNYHQAKLRIRNLHLDTSHFTGQAHLRGKSHSWSKKIPLDEILIKDSRYNGPIKKRLYQSGLLEEKCYVCGITEWNNKSLSLELEHKNGDRFDNRIENLTILCPNCHSQTEFFRGRNKKKHEEKTLYFCLECKKSLTDKRKTNLCIKCYMAQRRPVGQSMIPGDPNWRTKPKPHLRKVVRPNQESLKSMIKNMSWTAIGKKYKVSDNAVRKWAKGYGIL